jgi:hypothetical protein
LSRRVTVSVPQLVLARTTMVYFPFFRGAVNVTVCFPADAGLMVTDFTTLPRLSLIWIVSDWTSERSRTFTLNFFPCFTLPGADTCLIGAAKPVVNVLSPPLAEPSGLLANSWKWYVVHGVRFEMSADTACVFGVLQYGLGGLIPAGHEPIVPVGVCDPYAVVVPYRKKYWVGSPPLTFGPATPFNVADLAVTFVALVVVAVGGTFEQYGLGGVMPEGQTIVALPGPANTALAPTAARPPRSASRLRCKYLAM